MSFWSNLFSAFKTAVGVKPAAPAPVAAPVTSGFIVPATPAPQPAPVAAAPAPALAPAPTPVAAAPAPQPEVKPVNVPQASNDGTGSYPVSALTLADKIYLYQHAYAWAFVILSGSRADINAAINDAGSNHAAEAAMGGPDDGSQPTPALKALVDQTVQVQTAQHVANKAAEHQAALAKWQAKHPGVDINALLSQSVIPTK